MGFLPDMCQSFLRRFDANSQGEVTEPDGFPPQHNQTLMAIMLPHEVRNIHHIGDTAKLNDFGRPINSWDYELPPMAIVGVMQAVYHTPGIGRKDKMPFALKAVGRVNAAQIMAQQGQLVSENYVIVP